MATLVFSAIGTALGGPIGGLVGALVGRQVDAAIIGRSAQKGPRLKELEATASSYGAALPRLFGRMRVPGSIIWSTELVEHSETQGGGKGKPSITTYNYTASFAVAIASRPIRDIGRIWADGNLLRDADGRLRSGGTMRIHHGHGDQPVDPLLASAEGANRCPAWRGTAYVVFEDLELGDFFNRIPALTFEVMSDDTMQPITLDAIVGEVVDNVDAAVPLARIAGFSLDGPVVDALGLLEPLFPMDADAAGENLVFARERLQGDPIALPEAAISVGDGEFGGASGFARTHVPPDPARPEILRYYDVDRDYQPGLQRAPGRPAPGQPQTVELPAAITSDDARVLVERLARTAHWSRQRIVWRSSELNPLVAPGAIVTVPGQAGRWRVGGWEWRDSGVELALSRVMPVGIDEQTSGNAPPLQPTDPGRINPPSAAPPEATLLEAFELPWDGSGSGDTPALYAAPSAAGPNWSGAALFVDNGDGGLESLGPSGRTRSVTGVTESALPPASPHIFDRSSAVVVRLAAADLTVPSATGRQLAMGMNRALVGDEIIQFASAQPLGAGRYRLRHLLRGRGGTEAAAAGHGSAEPFVLLDSRPVGLDPVRIGDAEDVVIVASGRGDDDPVESVIRLRGITRQPLSPVHPRVSRDAGGDLSLAWTRRARGAWAWRDGVDAPLNEQAESYQVILGPANAPYAVWQAAQPALILPAAQLASLAATYPGASLHVRQQGSYAVSAPLFLTAIS